MKRNKDMVNHIGAVSVYLTGSGYSIRRVVYRNVSDGKYYIVWGGEYILVYNYYKDWLGSDGWRTVDLY